MTNNVPLLANVDQIAVVHYSINLACCLGSKKLKGWVTLKLSPKEDKIEDKPFRLILDACDLNVHRVFPGFPTSGCCPCQDDWLVNCRSDADQLTYTVDEWCIKIEKDDIFNAQHFPDTITIVYETKPQGSSLDWVPMGDNEYCCYTYGSWINNRSLLPCQEPPEAMATWSSSICVQEPLLVLMSSQEQSSQLCLSSPNRRKFHHTTDIILPISTLTLGLGFWQCRQLKIQSRGLDSINLYHAKSLCHLFDRWIEKLNSYLNEVVAYLDQLLGQYPFKRLDLVVTPRSFDALGMASPNLILLSQSIFTCTIGSPLFSRIAHELAHMWFGLMIGPQDWTEEWLSEGFATFIEETVHSALDKNDCQLAREKMEIRAYLKWKQMENECDNLDQSLTVLRPNHGEEIPQAVQGDVMGKLIVDGANPIKRTIQIHYLKGYFLLIHLKDLVGEENFFRFIRQLYEQNKGTLITSNTVFTSYCSFLNDQCKFHSVITPDYLAKTWLDSPGLPEIPFPYQIEGNRIFKKVLKMLEPIVRASEQRQTKRKRTKLSIDISFEPMEEEGLKLLLEKLLEIEHLSEKTLVSLRDFYQLNERNAEIRHSWCELIVKHELKHDYHVVTKFLQEEQAMGVYLYGELLNGESKTQRALGKQIFSSIQHEMNRNFKALVQDMISNTDAA